MCGIVGVVGTVTPATERSRYIENACALLQHRGPDGMGIYVDDVAALGAVRLPIPRRPRPGMQRA